MSDQCRHCTQHGDTVSCDMTECNIRESWRYKTLAKRCKMLETSLNEALEVVSSRDFLNIAEDIKRWIAVLEDKQ